MYYYCAQLLAHLLGIWTALTSESELGDLDLLTYCLGQTTDYKGASHLADLGLYSSLDKFNYGCQNSAPQKMQILRTFSSRFFHFKIVIGTAVWPCL